MRLEVDIQRVPSQLESPIAARADVESAPWLAPSRVTTDEPVKPILDAHNLLNSAEVREYAREALPTLAPTVMAARALPAPAPTDRKSIPLSDTHIVCSHPVPPPRPLPDEPALPILDPCSVRTADPVLATFRRRTTLPAPTVVEKPAVMLDCPRPTETDVLRHRKTPAANLNNTAVSDNHIDISHPVEPTLNLCEASIDPKPEPSKLTKIEPVPAKLLSKTLLKAEI